MPSVARSRPAFAVAALLALLVAAPSCKNGGAGGTSSNGSGGSDASGGSESSAGAGGRLPGGEPSGGMGNGGESSGGTTASGGTTNCLQDPSCEGDENEVSDCTGLELCRDVTACGTTIHCVTEISATKICKKTADCPQYYFCNFRDGKCGAGDDGFCELTPHLCSNGDVACYCDGTITEPGKDHCEGENGIDLDRTGAACSAPSTALKCGFLICDFGPGTFCETTPQGTEDYWTCGNEIACDPATCACLATRIADCNGTCVDGPNGPTITCSPG